MAKARALDKRRKAIRNIRKITRTMELIATSRFRKALDRAVQSEAFTRKVTELAADLSENAPDVKHPLLDRRPEVKRTLVLVLTSNRGLCGGYNASILREANGEIGRTRDAGVELELELSGKRAISYFRYLGVKAAKTYVQFEDKPTFAQVEELANRYIAEFTSGRIDRVQVVYMKFLNAARQVPVVETLLPLASTVPPGPAPGTPARGAALVQPGARAKKHDYEYMPGPRQILEEILPISFKVRLFKCFLDAAVSEQIARRVAMKAATENAGDMIKSLSRQYNRARQAQITKEIAEVIGGAEALK